MVEVGIDGACKGPPGPGPGGWGMAIFRDGEFVRSDYGGEEVTTNNRMELQAFVHLIHCIEDGLKPDIVWIDSRYVLDGCGSWLRGWILKDWKKSNGKPVENQDIWKHIATKRSVWKDLDMRWVKGHSGDPVNEAADAAANKGYESIALGDW